MNIHWPARAFSPVVEPLEERIAPAVITLSPSEFQPRENGVAVPANSSAAVAHATTAILLIAGDSLVFDPTGQDITLVKVATGSALVFLTDLAGNHEFAIPDLTGIAVSNAFRGSLGSDIDGSIVTALNSGGHLANVLTSNTISLEVASISGLTVKGQIAGSILASGNIDNVSAGTQQVLTGNDLASVTGDIETGTATDGHAVSFNGGSFVFTLTDFIPASGAVGGSITNVNLAQGAASIQTGAGGYRLPANGTAGAGGNIADVTLSMSTALLAAAPTVVIAAPGGDSAAGRGGAGGSIINLFETINGATAANISITAGAGGTGAGAGAGGAGGQILETTALLSGNLTGAVTMTGGAGGAAGAIGAGGAGGPITDANILAEGTNSVLGSVAVNGGAGGSSALGAGGAGGALALDSITTTASIVGGVGFTAIGIGFTAGAGGDGQTFGGSGGNLGSDAISALGTVFGGIGMAAGQGGGTGLLASIHSAAGQGGSIQAVDLIQNGFISSVSLHAGDGGAVAFNGHGGAGGGLSQIHVANNAPIYGSLVIAAGDGSGLHYFGGSGGGINNIGVGGSGLISDDFSLTAGNGASGSSTGFSLPPVAGSGGTISNALIQELGLIDGNFVITAGSSGLATAGGSAFAGSISSVTAVINSANSVNIAAGNSGGDSGIYVSNPGGSINNLTLKSFGAIATESIQAGAGGSSTGTGVRASSAGSGGSLVSVTIDNLGSIGTLAIGAAAGGSVLGANLAALGGGGGNVVSLDVNSIGSLGAAQIQAGAGGDTSSNGLGGAGGSVIGLVFNVPLSASAVSIVNGAGGDSHLGRGGGSGAITTIQLDGPSSDFTIGGSIAAGAGAMVGGTGGSISYLNGSVGTLEVRASDGGPGVYGGAGGSVFSVDIDAVGSFVRYIQAGNGGNGAIAGAGGSVNTVTVAGDLGDFSVPFGFTATGMGGLSSGIRGTGNGSAQNGLVSNITADRIASIVAGGGYQDADSVSSISLIHTNTIGADINGNGVFDFIKSPTPPHILFDAADGDIPIDGLVVVAAGGLNGVTAPILELIQVV